MTLHVFKFGLDFSPQTSDYIKSGKRTFMPYELKIDEPFASQGWKVKIREKERLEPPHVTVVKGTKSWRWDLRARVFMDKYPPVKEVPSELVAKLMHEYDELKKQWDLKYPENKV